MQTEVPPGWQEAELGEALDRIVGGGTPSRDVPSYWDGDVPWASVKDLTNPDPDRTQETITPEGVADSAANVVPAGTVIVATRMAVGKAIRFNVDVAINQDLKALLPSDDLEPSFLYSWLQGSEALIESRASGSTVKGLRASELKRMPLLLPPLPEQRKIAAILASVDEAIQATEAVIEQTRRVKEGLLQDLLTRGIGHARFKQTEIGEIPESWEVRRLGEVVPKTAIQNGLYRPASDYGEDGVPIIRIDSFQHGGVVDLSGLRRLSIPVEDVQRYRVQSEDIVLNRVNSLTHLAKSSIVLDVEEPTVFESNMMRLRMLGGCVLRPGFLIAVLALPYAWEHFQLRAKKAVAQASVNQGDVLALPVPIPPKAEQARIEEILRSTDRQVRAERETLRQHQQVKAGLLQDLLSGAVRVSE